MASLSQIISRVLHSSKVTEERTLAKELQDRLGTRTFLASLTKGSTKGSATSDGLTNGWTSLLKAVMAKLSDESRRSSHADFVAVLSRLVEEAERCGVLFEGDCAFNAIGLILNSLFDVDTAPSPVANLYWSVLRNLAAQPENFRAVGRERAQCLCADLADFAWAALLPPEESQQPKAASSAARLLTRLMVNFPYALPEHALATLLVNLVGLAKRCTPSAAGSAVFPAGIALLHQLWAAANSVLRRQAADCAELLWQAPRVQSPGGAHAPQRASSSRLRCTTAWIGCSP